ncbi:MAG: hypothetical protein V1867_03520 [Candidatus Falkowbacteria bacterium]
MNNREEAKKFLEEVLEVIRKKDRGIFFENNEVNPEKSIYLLDNGEVCGMIYGLSVRKGEEWMDWGYEKRPLNHMLVLNAIAIVLKKRGVKVFKDGSKIVIVQKHDTETKHPNIHMLYARSGFMGGVHGSRASIFADALANEYRYDSEADTLICRPRVWPGDPKEPEYIVPFFSLTEEEI